VRWLAVALLACSALGGDDGPASASAWAARSRTWLERQQAADGSWGDDEKTGFAVLAFVAAGKLEHKGLRYLRDRAGALDHPVAALAITDAYGCFRDPGLKRAAQRWVRWAEERARLATTAEEAAWAALLLQSGKLGRLEVDLTALRKLRDRLAAPRGRGTRELAQLVLLDRLGGEPDLAREARLLARLDGAPLSAREWLWGTAAAWQIGGKHWATWRRALTEQAKALRGAEDSWFGDIAATACFAMAMELATRWR
jgi:hypothetical protein